MKLHVFLTMALLVAASGFLMVSQSWASSPSAPLNAAQGHPRGPGGPGGPSGPGGPGGLPLRELNLTDEQKTQIKAIQDAEQIKIQSVHEQLRDIQCALNQATAKGQFDEARIRALATGANQARIELSVSQARVQAAVYKVLTADQQAKLDEIQQGATDRLCN